MGGGGRRLSIGQDDQPEQLNTGLRERYRLETQFAPFVSRFSIDKPLMMGLFFTPPIYLLACCRRPSRSSHPRCGPHLRGAVGTYIYMYLAKYLPKGKVRR